MVTMLAFQLLVFSVAAMCLQTASGLMYGLPPLTHMRRVQMEKYNKQRHRLLRLQQQELALEALNQRHKQREEQERQEQEQEHLHRQEQRAMADESSRELEREIDELEDAKSAPFFKVLRGAFTDSGFNKPSFKYSFVG